MRGSHFWTAFIVNNFHIECCSIFLFGKANEKFLCSQVKSIPTPKTSANFSFDHVNGIFDTCKRNVPSSSSSSKRFNEEDGVLWNKTKREGEWSKWWVACLQFEQVLVVELVWSFVFHLWLDEDVFDFVVFPTNFPSYLYNGNNPERDFSFDEKKIPSGSLHMVDVVMRRMKKNCYSSTTMVDPDQYSQMSMKVTNQPVVMVTMVKLENQHLLNELVLEKIIFALAIENMTIETMTTNHHPKRFYDIFLLGKGNSSQQSSNSSAKYRWVSLMKSFLPW